MRRTQGISLFIEVALAIVVGLWILCGQVELLAFRMRKIFGLVISVVISLGSASNVAFAEDMSQSCAQGGVCKLGDIGPGGGMVFFVRTQATFAVWKNTPNTEADYSYSEDGWKYLEVAPKSWAGGSSDPKMKWCNNSNTRASWTKDLQGRDWYFKWVPGLPQTGFLASTGFGNTEIISKNCSSGASNAAREYRGGGKTDWYLPRLTEMNQLAMFAGGKLAPKSACCIKDFPKSESASFASSNYSISWGSSYWSSAFSFGKLTTQNQSQNRMSIGTNNPGSGLPFVRPIRAF